MTTNQSIENWKKIIGDAVTVTANLDRFLHYAMVVTVKGRSYRLGKVQKPDNQEEEGWPVLTRPQLADYNCPSTPQVLIFLFFMI